jgi:hypothetical protein
MRKECPLLSKNFCVGPVVALLSTAANYGPSCNWRTKFLKLRLGFPPIARAKAFECNPVLCAGEETANQWHADC